jgi:TonB family protein
MEKTASYFLALILCGLSFSLIGSEKPRGEPVPAFDLPQVYQKWLDEEVVYIISEKEKQVFLGLKTDKERDLFIEAFWKQRDPAAATPENEFKTEHYRRWDYANQAFGTASMPGWKTERGRFYIVLGTADPYFEKVMKLRVYEGIKESGPPPPQAVTSSYLKYTLAANIFTEADLVEEQGRIKKAFGLKDIKLLTESDIKCKKGGDPEPSHTFRLDGKMYWVALASKEALAQAFRIEVFEHKTPEPVNLLDTEFIIPKQNSAVFGFEDSQGKPYFISLREQSSFVVTEAGAPAKPGEGKAQKPAVEPKNVKPPKLIKHVEPVYPKEAKKKGIEGVVILEATVDQYGRVSAVKVLRSIPDLNQAAIDAVRQWVYEPMVIGGTPKGMVITVTVRFSPEGKVGGVAGGVAGGVVGGVTGGVSGKVSGGVEGGVVGGVMGGVVGGVLQEKEEVAKKKQEFEKDAVPCKGEIKPPKLLKMVEPAYPEEAIKAGVQGVVILEAKTDEYGRVVDALILRSIPLLDQAAIDAVKQWVYEPMLIDGKPQKVLFTVTVRFDLNGKGKKASPGEKPLHVSADVPKRLSYVEPVYPEEARKKGIEGFVLLEVRTDEKGSIAQVKVLRSVPGLDQAAIDAVKQWKYAPMVIEGKAVPFVFTVTVAFKLAGEDAKAKEKPSP